VKQLGIFQANLTQMPDKVSEKESQVDKLSEEQMKQDIQKLLKEMDVPMSDWIDIKNLPKADWDRIGKKYAKGRPMWEAKLKWKLGTRDFEDAAKWVNTTNGKRFLASLEKDLEEWVSAGRYDESNAIVDKKISSIDRLTTDNSTLKRKLGDLIQDLASLKENGVVIKGADTAILKFRKLLTDNTKTDIAKQNSELKKTVNNLIRVIDDAKKKLLAAN
jgi:hypothetical protein